MLTVFQDDRHDSMFLKDSREDSWILWVKTSGNTCQTVLYKTVNASASVIIVDKYNK